jgi:hypothetical protein
MENIMNIQNIMQGITCKLGELYLNDSKYHEKLGAIREHLRLLNRMRRNAGINRPIVLACYYRLGKNNPNAWIYSARDKFGRRGPGRGMFGAYRVKAVHAERVSLYLRETRVYSR